MLIQEERLKIISNLLIKNNFSAACYYHAGIEFRQKKKFKKNGQATKLE